MTNSLVERWNRGCDSLPLLQEADQTITQLHAAVKTAQELAATRLMEIERLQSYWLGDKLRGGSDVCHTCHAHCVVIGDKDEEIERLRFAHERIKQRYFESVATMATGALVNELARISADALSGSSEPSEQRSGEFIEYPKPPYEFRGDSGKIECPMCAGDGSVYPPDEGASRDAPSHSVQRRIAAIKGEPFNCKVLGCTEDHNASPADLVGALQDVVHTDPGPVRAGKAHRDASSPRACAVDPRDAVIAELTKWADDWAVYRGPAEKPVDKGWRLAAEELQSILKKSATRT